MEKLETIRKYELVIIVDAKLTTEEKEKIVKEVGDSIAKACGKVINSSVWLEKHRLTFPIKKRIEGAYYLINYESEANVNGQVQPLLRLNEKILRFLIIQVEN